MVSKTQNYLFLILIVKQTKRPFFHDDMNYNIYLSYHFIKLYIVHITILLILLYGHHLIVMQYVRNCCITFSYQLFSLLDVINIEINLCNRKCQLDNYRRLSVNYIHSHCPAIIMIFIVIVQPLYSNIPQPYSEGKWICVATSTSMETV